MRVQIFKGQGRQPFYVRLVAENGQTLTVSEGYSRKWSAKRAAKRVFPGLEIEYVEAS